MWRVLLIAVFLVSRVSAGGDNLCFFIKSLTPPLNEQVSAEIINRGNDCSVQYQQLSADFKVNSSSQVDFASAIATLSDTCTGGIAELVSIADETISTELGITTDELRRILFGQGPASEPFSCFKEAYIQGIDLIASTVNSLNSEVDLLIASYGLKN